MLLFLFPHRLIVSVISCPNCIRSRLFREELDKSCDSVDLTVFHTATRKAIEELKPQFSTQSNYVEHQGTEATTVLKCQEVGSEYWTVNALRLSPPILASICEGATPRNVKTISLSVSAIVPTTAFSSTIHSASSIFIPTFFSNQSATVRSSSVTGSPTTTNLASKSGKGRSKPGPQTLQWRPRLAGVMLMGLTHPLFIRQV